MSLRTLLAVVLSASLSQVALGCAVQEQGHEDVANEDEPGLEDRAAESLGSSLSVGTTIKATTSVNVRTGPGSSYSVVYIARTGESATILVSSPTSGYYKVRFEGRDLWTHGAYWTAASGGTGGSGTGGSTPSGSPWTCTGSYATKAVDTGKYAITAFGCWVDEAGGRHGDSGDNCIPGCLAEARSAGLCSKSETGKACEERVTWYIADAGRFGCLARVKIRNPKNGKTVVAVALDYGPACWVERKISGGVLDASGRVNRYLFGEDKGVEDRAMVEVTVVSSSTRLGPQ